MHAQTIDLNQAAEKAKRRRKIECMTFREATRHIYLNEGPRGFLRGLVPSLIKNSLMTGQYFSILFYMEQMLEKANMMSQKKNQAAAAALTKATQTVTANPIIVVKTRFEVVGFNQYNGVADAF